MVLPQWTAMAPASPSSQLKLLFGSLSVCSQTAAVCFGKCSTSGSQNKVDAYRSELQGCHATFLGLLALPTHYQLCSDSITFHFNNDARLERLQREIFMSLRFKHLDLIRAICVNVYKLKMEHESTFTFHEVKGHRVNHPPCNHLTWLEEMK
jgi:hypothetical protein